MNRHINIKSILIDGQEWIGLWFYPGTTDYVGGVLHYSREKSELKLHGTLEGLEILKKNEEDRLIYGYLNTGEKVSLLGCFLKQSSLSMPGFEVQTYFVSQIYIGTHCSQEKNTLFDSMDLYISGIDAWTLHNAFSKSSNDHKNGFSIIFSELDDFKFDVPSKQCTITFTYYLENSGSPINEWHTHYYPALKIKPERPSCADWYMDIFYSIRKLFCFMLGNPCQMQWIDAYTENQNCVILIKDDLPNFDQFNANEAIITLECLAQNDNYFDKWFMFDDKYKTSLNLMLHSLLLRPPNYINLVFIGAVQAYEIYHRILTRVFREKFLDRIRFLLEKLSPEFVSTCIVDVKNFSSAIDATRNYYVHYNNIYDDRKLPDELLRHVSNILLMSYLIIIFDEMGIEQRVVIESFRFRNDWILSMKKMYQHMIKITNSQNDNCELSRIS